MQWLLRTVRKENLDYFFFYGHKADPDGKITASCFSQWWPTPFTVEETTYATAEHWMMAQKALVFDDREMFAAIIEASSPAKAKKLGRQVRNFNEDTWKSHRSNIVVQGNLHKFSQNIPLKEFLFSTGDLVLVEASPRDKIWGIDLGANDHRVNNPQQWTGLNLLGFALMEVRDHLFSGHAVS